MSVGLSGLMLLFLVRCGSDGLENPNYPDIPSIKFEKIKFIEVGSASDYDTLKLTFSYRDGDSNLGLSASDQEDARYPFHSEDYFLEDGTGDTIPVQTEIINSYVGINSVPQNGILVTNDTRQKVNYAYLPVYNPTSCLNYSFMSEFLVRKDLNIINASFNIADTITVNGVDYIKIIEPLLYRINENHYNILVDFYVFNDGEFRKFDWFGEYCISYDGRFPIIGDKRGGTFKSGPFKINIKTPWEGKITYNMSSTSFPAIFGNDTPLKLAITIKDRSLNTSNTLFSPEFTLESIK